MTKLKPGDLAPDFRLGSSHNATIELSSLRGQYVVLFFYPKDDTSGCTQEALDFSTHYQEFLALSVCVFGISPDSLASHAKFSDKHSLNIPLLSDEGKLALNAYNVFVEKSMYGRKYMGVERSTFLLNRDGVIVELWRKVKVNGHVAEVLTAAKALVLTEQGQNKI